jgi:hypothetical protein
MENPNPDALVTHLVAIGVPQRHVVQLLRGFTGYADAFRAASEKLERTAP